MDFQINIHTDFESHVEQFLLELLERGYSQNTVKGYRSDLNRMKKYILTSIRRFNDYLSGSPYIFRKNKGAQMPPLVFRDIVNDYITYMSEQGYKRAAIEVRKIFAVQFLASVYQQGVHSINEISGAHVGCAVLSASSVEGMCQKLPCFLKFLYQKGLAAPELQKAITGMN